jgi:hypothetical protein
MYASSIASSLSIYTIPVILGIVEFNPCQLLFLMKVSNKSIELI